MSLIVTGEAEPAAALASALTELGAQAELVVFHAGGGESALSEAFSGLEARVDEGARALISAGAGEIPVVAALTAVKCGVPLIAALSERERGDEPAAGEARIVARLCQLKVGLPGEGVGADAIAERILAWLEEEPGVG